MKKFLVLFLFPLFVFSQSKTVTGIVNDENRFLFDSNLKPKPAVFAIKKALIDKNTSLVLYD